MGYPAWPDEKSARCFSLRLDGLTFAQIATEMGISRSAVSSHLNRHAPARDDAPPPVVKTELRPDRDCRRGTYNFETPARRENDDRKHLMLMLAAFREARAA